MAIPDNTTKPIDISYEALLRELSKHSPEVQLAFYTTLLEERAQ